MKRDLLLDEEELIWEWKWPGRNKGRKKLGRKAGNAEFQSDGDVISWLVVTGT